MPTQDPTFTNAPVKEVYSTAGTPYNRSSGVGDMAFSVLESPNMLPDQEVTEKFRAAFAYDEKETLLGCRSKSLIKSSMTLTVFWQIFPVTSTDYCLSAANYTSLAITFASNPAVR